MLKSKKLGHFHHAFQYANIEVNRNEQFFSCKQVHGKEVIEVGLETNSTTLQNTMADGLVISTPNFTAGIQTADCMPVLFAAKDPIPTVAAIHAGWRGLNEGILLVAVQKFKNLGIPAQNIVVAIGPCIRQCCFEVSQDVFDVFEKNWQVSSYLGLGTGSGHSGKNLDMPAIAQKQLISQGLIELNIDDLKICTYCGSSAKEPWESFRRTTHENKRLGQENKAGRQWSWISLKTSAN